MPEAGVILGTVAAGMVVGTAVVLGTDHGMVTTSQTTVQAEVPETSEQVRQTEWLIQPFLREEYPLLQAEEQALQQPIEVQIQEIAVQQLIEVRIRETVRQRQTLAYQTLPIELQLQDRLPVPLKQDRVAM
jgi:hypothetical protein